MLEKAKSIFDSSINALKNIVPGVFSISIKELGAWIESTYTVSKTHEACTGSLYYIVSYNDMDICKIRLADHQPAFAAGADLMVTKSINTNDYVILFKRATLPIVIGAPEIKSFISHYILIRQCEKISKIAIDASSVDKKRAKIDEKYSGGEQITTSTETPKVNVQECSPKSSSPWSPNNKSANMVYKIIEEHNRNRLDSNWKAARKYYVEVKCPWTKDISSNHAWSFIKDGYVSKHTADLSFDEVSDMLNNIYQQYTHEHPGVPAADHVSEIFRSWYKSRPTVETVKPAIHVNDSTQNISEPSDDKSILFTFASEAYGNWSIFEDTYLVPKYDWYQDLAKTNKIALRKIYNHKDLTIVQIDEVIERVYEMHKGVMKMSAFAVLSQYVKHLAEESTKKEESN